MKKLTIIVVSVLVIISAVTILIISYEGSVFQKKMLYKAFVKRVSKTLEAKIVSKEKVQDEGNKGYYLRTTLRLNSHFNNSLVEAIFLQIEIKNPNITFLPWQDSIIPQNTIHSGCGYYNKAFFILFYNEKQQLLEILFTETLY